MAFPTNRTRRSLAAALDRAQSQADTIKRLSESANVSMAAGAVTSSFVLSLLANLRSAKDVFDETAALPGIVAYALDQLNDEIDVAAEFVAMTDALTAAGAWIITNIPKAADGALKLEDMDAQGNRTERTFSTTATAPLRTLLDTLIATID